MKRDTAKAILYQLVHARKVLQDIAQGNADSPKDVAGEYFFRFIGGVSKVEVDEFFDTPKGRELANDFGVRG